MPPDTPPARPGPSLLALRSLAAQAGAAAVVTLTQLRRRAGEAGAAAAVALADRVTRGEHRHLAMRCDALADLAGHDADTTDQLRRELDDALAEKRAAVDAAVERGMHLDAFAGMLAARGHARPTTHAAAVEAVAKALGPANPLELHQVVDQLDADVRRWCRETEQGRTWPLPPLVRRELCLVLGARVLGWIRAGGAVNTSTPPQLADRATTNGAHA